MLKLTMIAVGVLSLGLPGASYSEAPTVDLVLGTLVQPMGLKKGDTLQPGTPIETGASGLLVYTESWESNHPGFDCLQVTMVGYGESHRVVSLATPGRCVPGEMAVPRPGQPLLSSATRYERYAGGKADAPVDVVAANEKWREFDAWMKSATEPGVMGPLVPGLVYLQGDYRSELVASAEACSALCAREPQCRAMTFIISQGRCWLKNTVPPTAESSDMISAARQ